MDAATGLVLYQTDAHKAKYPASITKVMTALVVLDHTTDFDERIVFSERAIFATPRYSSHIAMDVGETLSVYEALYALMLPSANEVSLALAEHVAGSVEAFVDLMNRRARSLGADNTHFVNPSGLPGEGHVTTAYDIALIMREAVQNPLFVDIIATRRFDIPPTERQPEVRALRNTNRLIHEGPYFNEAVVGSKTGWTNDAGHTLVTYAVQDERRLIVSVLGGGSPYTFVDTTALLAYGFDMPFEPVKVFDAAAYVPAVPVFQTVDGALREVGRVPLAAAQNMYFDLPPGFDTSLLRYEFTVPQGVAPPIETGAVLGSAAVYVGDFRIGATALRATAYVLKEPGDAHLYTAPEAAYVPQYVTYIAEESSEAPPSDPGTREMFMMLVAPIAIAGFTLVVSLAIHLAKRNKRLRGKMHARYARYPQYRYK
ncbi:MAG: D-alanyl-D-alanine carboxypeptidase [Defluviitaleaceae bacterium]|nr:D-alanyl-D-alanine carboxypeptidase [Defluviitaleaceae bacterium]